MMTIIRCDNANERSWSYELSSTPYSPTHTYTYTETTRDTAKDSGIASETEMELWKW